MSRSNKSSAPAGDREQGSRDIPRPDSTASKAITQPTGAELLAKRKVTPYPRALREALRKYPAFTKPVKPLKIGIDGDLKALGHPPAAVDAFLLHWCLSKDYLAACVADPNRYDLQGAVAGWVSLPSGARGQVWRWPSARRKRSESLASSKRRGRIR